MVLSADVIDLGFSMRILVVDDDRDTAHSLQMLMRMSGHEAQVAFDGAGALAAAAWFHPQIVVLDLSMNGMNGYDVARVLARDPARSSMTLVAFTGWQQPAVRERTREAGFDACLLKPMDFGALRDVLTAHVARGL